MYACKALDDLLKNRLIREENGPWIEKAVITQIWLSTSNIHAENALEQLQQILDMVLQESGTSLSAPATHAAQTLIWKKVEDKSAQEQHESAEAWCRLGLHPMFEKAGAQNKIKITRSVPRSCGSVRANHCRKLIQTAFSRQDYTAAREVYRGSPKSGRDEPITRYMMYKVGLKSGDADFGKLRVILIVRAG